MRLKQLEVHGFKTFANRTDFTFREGITAIVGPNGCGKSNIADAIRWALGEQSPSNLRTKKTEDLIFTGSTTRARMGMAEVAITLENPFSLDNQADDPAAPPAAEIDRSTLVTAPSNGNGAHPTGDIGPDAERTRLASASTLSTPRATPHTPSIVEEILRARPSEVTIVRRAYRSGENEYLINRQRVRLRDVQELLQRWGLARLTYAVIGQGLIDQALSLRAEERRQLFEEAAGIGLYQTKKANALDKLEETRQNLIRVNDIINEIAPRLPSLARQADRAGKYESVATALNDKLRQWYAFNWAHAQEGFIVAQTAEDATRQVLTASRGAMQDLAAQLAESRRTAQTLRARLAEHRRIQQERENEFVARERDLAVLTERSTFADTQHTDALRDLDAAALALQSAQAALEPSEPAPASESVEMHYAITEPSLELSSDISAESVIETASSAPEPLLPELPPPPAPETFAQRLAEFQAQLQAESEQFETAAQRRIAESDAALAQLDASHTEAEQVWHAESENLAQQFEGTAQSQQSLDASRTAALVQAHEDAEHRRARTLARQRLAQSRLAELDAAPPFDPASLPSTDLAASLIDLQARLPMYEHALAAVSGLAAQADDLARRDRELRERERLLERVRADLAESKNTLALAERDLTAARAAIDAAAAEQARVVQQQALEAERTRRDRDLTHERALELYQRERERLARDRANLDREREQRAREHRHALETQERELAREQARLQQDYERALAERTREQERLVAERQREQERLRAEQLREQERLAAERIREQQRLAQLQQQEQLRLQQDYERAVRDHTTRAERVSQFAARVAALTAERAVVSAQVDEMRAALDALRQDAFPDETALAASERVQVEFEEHETQLRSELTVAEERHNHALLEAERRRAEIARLEQEIEDDLGSVELDSATPRQLRLRLVVRARPGTAPTAEEVEPSSSAEPAALVESPDAPPQELVTLPEVTALPDGFEQEIRRLKNQMRYIGNVNPNAPAEYAELKERHAFLTEQAADLTSAIEKLQQATQELDAMMKQKFQETFNAINTEFRKYFAMLFGGGAARLELTDPTDVIHSGIEISARPPGKRAAQLVLLSGGERALTAAALIFSILRVSPTPFCVMDEVDAALDEANVGRFRDSLQELAHATQFIVITHNRVTMEGARAIYGVSMGEDGISQVLSLRLDQPAVGEPVQA